MTDSIEPDDYHAGQPVQVLSLGQWLPRTVAGAEGWPAVTVIAESEPGNWVRVTDGDMIRPYPARADFLAADPHAADLLQEYSDLDELLALFGLGPCSDPEVGIDHEGWAERHGRAYTLQVNHHPEAADRWFACLITLDDAPGVY
jgi:hypothetical protein